MAITNIIGGEERRAGFWALFAHRLTRKTRRKPTMPAAPASYCMMAYPPSETMMVPVWERGDVMGYRQVGVRPDWITDETDLWADPSDWIPGEHDVVMSVQRPDGTTMSSRDVVDVLVELKASCPATWARLVLAVTEDLADQESSAASLN